MLQYLSALENAIVFKGALRMSRFTFYFILVNVNLSRPNTGVLWIDFEFGNFRKFSTVNFRKFIPIFPEISGTFLKSFFLCRSTISKSSDAVK